MIRRGIEAISITSYVQLEEIATPTITTKGSLRIYAKSKNGVSHLYYLDDQFVEHDMEDMLNAISRSEPITTGDGIDFEEVYGVFPNGTSDIVVGSVRTSF